jgi:hypothetical protein
VTASTEIAPSGSQSAAAEPHEGDSVIIESHHLVYSYCDRLYGRLIERDLHERPLEIRKKFFHKLAGKRPLLVERNHLLGYLEHLSNGFAKGLARHSPYFWLFLYRRIKPVLSPNHDNITDANTTLLVRQISELAILKYGRLAEIDLRPSSEVPFEERWGGYLKLAIANLGEKAREAIISSSRQEPSDESLVPVTFRPEDYRGIYANEGLGYEYWLCTARLRSIGKGMKLWFDPSRDEFSYEESAELSKAIERFDGRITGETFFSTLIGITTPDASSTDSLFRLFSASYNVEGLDLSDLFSSLGYNAKSMGGPLTNFVPSLLAVDRFVEAHAYLDSAFKTATGLGLESFMYTLWAISSLALISKEHFDSNENFGRLMLQLLKRGYAIYCVATDELESAIKTRVAIFPELDDEKLKDIGDQASIALAHVTLSSKMQKKISMWSGGPRPIVIPFGAFSVIDVVGILEFIGRMFTGIQDDGTLRGEIFEETVRSSIADMLGSEFEIGPRKIYDAGNLVDEIDLLLRRKDKVYVCECFSMWKPLNFEIGDKKTIAARTERIDEKLNQAMDTCRYLSEHLTGSNYKYDDVGEFVPIVVSPFIEWLPNISDRYWISAAQPRVMTLDELVKYLNEERAY